MAGHDERSQSLERMIELLEHTTITNESTNELCCDVLKHEKLLSSSICRVYKSLHGTCAALGCGVGRCV